MGLLQDAQLNEKLAREGMVVFPMLEADQVQALKDLYAQAHPQAPQRFYASAHSSDLEFRRRMNQGIMEVLEPALRRHLAEARALGASFIAKPGGQQGLLPPHQDWNITTEPQHSSYNLWIPLVDMHARNGAFHYIPQSHRWLHTLRGPNIPSAFGQVQKELWDYLRILPMQAGEALLYDHRLLHASPLNETDELRLACVMGVMEPEAELRFYYREGEDVTAYRATLDFFFSGDPADGPLGLEALGPEQYTFPAVDASQLRKFVMEHTPELVAPSTVPAPPSWWQRLLHKITPS